MRDLHLLFILVCACRRRAVLITSGYNEVPRALSNFPARYTHDHTCTRVRELIVGERERKVRACGSVTHAGHATRVCVYVCVYVIMSAFSAD